MERAAKVIKGSKYSKKYISDDEMIRAVWPAAVGKKIAEHTSRVRLVRTTVVVEVEDAIWQKQLFPLTRQILERLHAAIGMKTIDHIEFRIGIPRMTVQRAEVRDGGLFRASPDIDEGDTIQDPVLKKIYRLSRKKATA